MRKLHFAFTVCLSLLAVCLHAESYKFIGAPAFGYLKLTDVQRTRKGTSVSFALPKGDQFRVSKKMFLEDQSGKRYPLKGIAGLVEKNERFYFTSDSIFTLTFEALPDSVKIFDLFSTNQGDFPAFYFWGIHAEMENETIEESSEDSCMLEGKEYLTPGIVTLRGKIHDYKAGKGPADMRLDLINHTKSGFLPADASLNDYKVKISPDGSFEKKVWVEGHKWTSLVYDGYRIPVYLVPGDVFEIDIRSMAERRIEYHTAKAQNMQNLLKIDINGLIQWRIQISLNANTDMSVLRDDILSRLPEQSRLREYLSRKYKLSEVESHLLDLYLQSYLYNSLISGYTSKFLEKYPLKELNKMPVEDVAEIINAPATLHDFDFLHDVNINDFGYIMQPNQDFTSRVFNLLPVFTGMSKKVARYETLLEKYLGRKVTDSYSKFHLFDTPTL